MSPRLAAVEPRAFSKRRNLWLAHASEIASPLLRLAARSRAKRPPSPRHEWRRGLILGHTHIGDVLYRTCSLPALREHLPNCEWYYATTAGAAEVLKGNPHVREILPVINGEDSWDLVDGGFDQLASRDFDVALCTNTLRHYPDLLLASFLGIPNRVGFSGKGFSGLMTQAVTMNFPESYASYFRAMVAAVLGRPADWELRPRLYPSEGAEAGAARIWSELGLSSARAVVACSLTTRQARGNWPAEVLLAILENARRQQEFDIVFSGGTGDVAYLNALAHNFPFDVRVLAGRADLLTFAAFLSRCSALLTLDSGPRHIGNAMRIPVVFARNLSHSRVEAGAYCAGETDLAPRVEHLSSAEADTVARSQPVPLLATTLLSKLRHGETPA